MLERERRSQMKKCLSFLMVSVLVVSCGGGSGSDSGVRGVTAYTITVGSHTDGLLTNKSVAKMVLTPFIIVFGLSSYE